MTIFPPDPPKFPPGRPPDFHLKNVIFPRKSPRGGNFVFARKFFAIFQNRDFFDFFQFFENLKIYTSVRETGKNLEIFCREQNFPKNFFRRTGGRENPENPEISPPNSRLNDQLLPKFSPPGKSRNFPKFFGIFSTKSTVCYRFLLFVRVKI